MATQDISSVIKKQIEQIDDCLKDINKKWFGFSWREDYGKILKQLKKSEGVITVNINLKLPKELRSRIPSLKGD